MRSNLRAGVVERNSVNETISFASKDAGIPRRSREKRCVRQVGLCKALDRDGRPSHHHPLSSKR